MDIFKPIAKFILDPLYALHEKSSHRRLLKEYERTQYMSQEKIVEQQFLLLKNILIHAYKNCHFYKEKFDAISFDPNKFSSIDEIKKIPILTKKDIQQNFDNLTARNYSENQLLLNQTGGSTGSPLKFYVDLQRLHSRKASTFRHDRWAGWDIGTKTAVLWGHQGDFLPQQNWKTQLQQPTNLFQVS